ncbi:phage integrase N-terminal SAM-like domain-containing protein [Alteromonas sp. S015]|uniref:phage integrase N-terminal SAM-like domain-containing protein n=1 Tax=Alteromonas sp. S015 TaxID=3117401 RepID=UPI003F68B1CD
MDHKKIRIAESGQNLINRIPFAVNRLGYSKRTEQTYSYWIKHFLNYRRTTPAQGLCTEHINRFLQHISNRNKSATTVNAAINAINFLSMFWNGRCASLTRSFAPNHRQICLLCSPIKKQ